MASQTRHVQEPTSFSVTETIVERREASTQDSKSLGIEDIEKTTSPKPLLGTAPRPHPRERTTFDPRTLPPVIPPDHPHRTLVLCFDGTGDQFDADNSNIVQLVSLLKKDERAKQMVYYQTGIGTYTSPKIATPWISRIRKTLDTMFASSIHAHVMSGYEFLMQNYTAGDRICIFGFSRGAYTARSLAGMVHKVGLLPPNNFEQVPFAYKMYLRTDTIGWEQSNEFKNAFCINVDIEFVGVWDTVDSVGIIPKRLPFTTSNTIVKTFRHAVSLDERRAKFKANLWNRPTAEEEKLGLPDPNRPAEPNIPAISKEATVDSDEVSLLFKDDKKRKEKTNGQATKPRRGGGMTLGIRTVNSDDKLLNAYERIYSEKNERMTDIEEVWFAGCHCDVGGGSVSNKTRHSLARIPLRWMVREIFKAQTGILFITERLTTIGIDPSSLYPFVVPRPDPLPVGETKIRKHPAKEIPIRPHMLLTKKNRPTIADVSKPPPISMLASEEEEELMDALSPVYDQLKIKKGWWLLEIIPLQLRYQRGNNQWVTYFGLNHAKPRFIPKQRAHGLKVHRSVKLRMEAEYEDEIKRQKGKKYEPRPEFKVEPTWVD